MCWQHLVSVFLAKVIQLSDVDTVGRNTITSMRQSMTGWLDIMIFLLFQGDTCISRISLGHN